VTPERLVILSTRPSKEPNDGPKPSKDNQDYQFWTTLMFWEETLLK